MRISRIIVASGLAALLGIAALVNPASASADKNSAPAFIGCGFEYPDSWWWYCEQSDLDEFADACINQCGCFGANFSCFTGDAGNWVDCGCYHQ